jgi:hypothetical protein
MKRCLALILILIAMPAEAKFRTASEWAGLPPQARTFYVAGVRDLTAMFASQGKDALKYKLLARIHTCLGAARFAPAEAADYILEWIKFRADASESNVAGMTLSYFEKDCRRASADHTEPAKPAVTYKSFVALTPLLQASYVEAIHDTLEAVSRRGESWMRQLHECMIRSGLTDARRLADAVTEYSKLNDSRVEPDASFAEVTVSYLLARCKQ